MLADPASRGLHLELRGRRRYWVRPVGTKSAGHDTALHEHARGLAGSTGRRNPKLTLYHAEKLRKDLDSVLGPHVKLSDLKAAFTPDGLHSKILSLKVEHSNGKPQLNIGMVLKTPDGKDAGVINRTFERSGGKLTVHHELFDLKEEHQGKGLAKNVMRKSLQAYEKAGVHAVHVDAMDVGRYTWASMGFRAQSASAVLGARAKLGEYIDKIGLSAHRKGLLAKASDFPEIAALTHNGRPIGREFLLHDTQPRLDIWSGKLRIDRADPYYQHARHKLGL